MINGREMECELCVGMHPASSFDTDTDYCPWAFFDSPAENRGNTLRHKDRYVVMVIILFVFITHEE